MLLVLRLLLVLACCRGRRRRCCCCCCCRRRCLFSSSPAASSSSFSSFGCPAAEQRHGQLRALPAARGTAHDDDRVRVDGGQQRGAVRPRW